MSYKSISAWLVPASSSDQSCGVIHLLVFTSLYLSAHVSLSLLSFFSSSAAVDPHQYMFSVANAGYHPRSYFNNSAQMAPNYMPHATPFGSFFYPPQPTATFVPMGDAVVKDLIRKQM